NLSIAASRGPAPFEALFAASRLAGGAPALQTCFVTAGCRASASLAELCFHRDLNKDQRPANSTLARFVLRRRFAMVRPKVGSLLEGTRSARNPSKRPDVTRPSAASWDKASSTWEGNKLLRRTNSLKKSAPPLCSAS